MDKPPVIVVVPVGGVVPPLEAIKAEADVILVRTPDEFRDAHNRAKIMFLNDFRSNLLREIGPGTIEWIHTSSIGVDALLTESIVHGDVVVSNSRGVCERPIAEWILGVLLMFTKDLRTTIELQHERRWLHRETEPILGRKVLVIGPGPVGKETVLLLRAAGMNVTVVGRSARRDPDLGDIESLDRLDELLPDAQDVVLTLPLTPDTRGMFNVAKFAKMQRGTRIVNVGRGAVIVENDLIDAIESGQLGGAALDVFEQEPLPESNALWQCKNVLVSPHASGDLYGWRGKVVDSFVRNLVRWKAGEPIVDVVDVAAIGVTPPALSGN